MNFDPKITLYKFICKTKWEYLIIGIFNSFFSIVNCQKTYTYVRQTHKRHDKHILHIFGNHFSSSFSNKHTIRICHPKTLTLRLQQETSHSSNIDQVCTKTANVSSKHEMHDTCLLQHNLKFSNISRDNDIISVRETYNVFNRASL